jgi:hypothetical protein
VMASKWQTRAPNVPKRVSGPCPFCPGEYTIDADAAVETSPGVVESLAVVLHTIPHCRVFEDAADALDFAVKARKAREKKARN